MSTKFDLLKEFCEVDNQIKKIKGQPLFEIEKMSKVIEKDAEKFTKEELQSKLANRKQDLIQLQKAEESKKKTEEYFNSSVGRTHKEMIEADIDSKKAEIKVYRASVITKIEELLHAALGDGWKVYGHEQGKVRIAIIDKTNTTPENITFFYGQAIDIRYNKPQYGETEDSFEVRVNSCDSFNPESHDPGAIATYYKGVGRLLDNQLLVKMLKKTLKDSLEESERLLTELTQLRKALIDPLGLNKNNNHK